MPRPRKRPPTVRVSATWNPAKFRESVESSGMSQESVARAAGLPLRTVQVYLRHEGGVASPGGDKVIALARVLGVRVEDWFDVTVEK